MNISAELALQARSKTGRQVTSLRRDGFVPTNIVSRGKDSVMGQVEYNVIAKVLNVVGYTQPVMLTLDGEKYTVLVTDVSLVSAKNTIEHVTFQEVKKGEQIHVEVPINLVGDAPATIQGNLILQLLEKLEIQTGALSIPEGFDVDISSLMEDGDTIHASSITLPEGVVLLTDPDAGIVKAEAPRVQEEPEEDEEAVEGEEGEEGEEAASEEDSAEAEG